MINTTNLCSGYGKQEKIHNVDIDINKNRITAIIGPNGCGKSTLLKTIANLIPKISGNISIDGKDIVQYKENELAKEIAYMPQFRDTPNISVANLVLQGRYPYINFSKRYTKDDYNKAYKSLETVGMSEFANKNLLGLSGGERQKVYLAMILAQDTDIVLLDEPTTYLDIDYQFEVWKIATNMKKEGKTVVIVTHEILQALNYADNIIVMRDGKILSNSSSTETYNSHILEEVFNICINKHEENYYIKTV